MIGIPELLGGSLGTMMGNPFILVAGLVVARMPPNRGRFWLELAAAIVVCTAIQFTFDKGLSNLPSDYSLGRWLLLVGFGTVWATVIFLLVRGLRSLLRRPSASVFD